MALPAELMRNVPTLEEFWAAFTKSREEEARHREEEARHREEEARHREEETAKSREEEARRQEKWERDREEAWALQRKIERDMDKLDKQMGELHNRFGEMAEHLVAPGIVSRFNELGYHFNDTIAERVKILDESGRKVLTEIDLLLQNGEYSIAVEVKSRPTEKDIGHHRRRLEILREHLDRRKDGRKIRGGIAGAVFPEGVKEGVIEAGMYVIEQSGDTMRINVPEGFKPKEW